MKANPSSSAAYVKVPLNMDASMQFPGCIIVSHEVRNFLPLSSVQIQSRCDHINRSRRVSNPGGVKGGGRRGGEWGGRGRGGGRRSGRGRGEGE